MEDRRHDNLLELAAGPEVTGSDRSAEEVPVLRPDAILEACVPIELLSGGFDPGAPWSSVFVSSGRQCGRSAAMFKPPLDDQRGRR